MKNTRYLCFFVFISALSILLSGCGASNDRKTKNVGYLTEITVSGLTYSTETQSGITGNNGEFTYRDDETISFSLGGITIGETVTAKEKVTLLDLIPTTILYTTNKQVKKMLSANSNAHERIAFFKFANILMFLQSLDEDFNPDNGINIPTGVADILIGKDINFEEGTFYDFQNKLLSVTMRAKSLGLLDSGNVKPIEYALDYFYNTQEIAQNFVSISTKSFDNDTTDAHLIDRKTLYTYDAKNKKLTDNTIVYDLSVLSYSYDTAYTYDTSGNILSIVNARDGEIHDSNTSIYIYNENGLMLESHEPNNSSNIFRYYENGNLQSSGYIKDDEYYKETYTYYANDNLKTSTYDDITTTYTYNSDNNVKTAVKVSATETYTITASYNNDGNLVSINNGTEDIISNIYDTNGNLQTRFKYGEIYTYDANENLISISNGSMDIAAYTYDNHGNRLTEKRDYIDEPNTLKTITYDIKGNILTEHFEFNLNTPDHNYMTSTYSYDYYENMLTENHEYKKGGNISYSRATYTWISSSWAGLDLSTDSDLKGFSENIEDLFRDIENSE